MVGEFLEKSEIIRSMDSFELQFQLSDKFSEELWNGSDLGS